MTRGFPIKIQIAFFLLAFLGLLASIWYWVDVNRTGQLSERHLAQIEETRLEVLAGLGGQLLSVNQPGEMQPLLATLVETAQIESVWLIDRANQIVAGIPANWIGRAPPDFTQNPGAGNRWRVQMLEVMGRPAGKLAILFPHPQTAWVGRLSGREMLLPAVGMILMALVLGFMVAFFFNRRLERIRNAPRRVPDGGEAAEVHRPGVDASAPEDAAYGADDGAASRKVERGIDGEAALRESRERYVRALTGASDGFWDWNIETGENYFSSQWLEILGYAEGDLEHSQDIFKSLIHPADLDAVSQAKSAHLEKGELYNVEFRLRKKNGDYLWVRSKGQAEWNEAGRLVGMAGTISDISRRKAAEAALRQSEDRYARAMAGTQDGLWDWNIETGENYFSPRWLEILGYAEGDLEARQEVFLPLVHPEDQEFVSQAKKAHLEDHQPYHVEYRLRKKDGGYLWIRSKAQVEWDEQGKPLRMTGSISDISERKKAEEAARTSEEMLRSFMDHSPATIFLRDLEGRYTMVNRLFEEERGKTAQEILGKTPNDLFPSEYAISFIGQEQEVLKTGKPVEREQDVPRADGTMKRVLNIKFPLFKPDGEMAGIGTIATDITERKKAEEALRKNERLLRTVFDTIPQWIFVKDLKRRFMMVNRALADTYNKHPDEFTNATTDDFLIGTEAQRDMFRKVDLSVMETGSAVDLHDVKVTFPDGKTHFQHIVKMPLLDDEGKIVGLLGVIEDVTERKKAADALRESEDRYARVMAGTQDGIWDWNIETGENYFSPRWLEILGFAGDDLTARQEVFMSLVHPEDKDLILKAKKSHLENHEPYYVEYRTRQKDGEYIWVRATGQAEWNEEGTPVRMTGSISDISLPKKAEEALKLWNETLEQRVTERTAALESAQEELVRKEKMATLGQLTATVSHELRNPLGTIRTSVFSIIKKTSPDTLGIGQSLARIDRNVTRCDDIIRDLLDYTRNRAPKPSPTDVDQWIADLMKEQIVPDWLKLELKLAVGNRPVELDQEYLRRAVINLYDNARQALEALRDGSKEKKLKITIGTRIEGKWLKIRVKDTGPGMTEDVLDKIFEPLFSTKTYGVGLGLPTVRQIIELNGGSISIKSKLGKGTEAVLKLPLSPRSKIEDAGPMA